jgi:hypothetical protein
MPRTILSRTFLAQVDRAGEAQYASRYARKPTALILGQYYLQVSDSIPLGLGAHARCVLRKRLGVNCGAGGASVTENAGKPVEFHLLDLRTRRLPLSFPKPFFDFNGAVLRDI